MSAGTLADVYVDCNECCLRFFGSQAGLLEGMTLRMVRRAARDKGWQTGVRRPDDDPRAGSGPYSLLDYCPQHKRDTPT
jgi:hypothetical protein